MRTLLRSTLLLLLGASSALALPVAGASKKKAPAPAPAPAPKPAPAPAPALPAHTLPNPNQQFADPYGYNRSLWGAARFGGVPMGGVGGAPMVVGGGGQGGTQGSAMGAGQAPNVVVGGSGADLSLTAPQLVGLLADPMYSDDGKTQTEVEILQGGLSSVPALVAALGDKRTYAEREIPGANGTMERVKVTLAEECEALLYHIVTPRYRSPHEAGVKPQNPVIFSVKNWPAWWSRNKGKSLKDVHADMRVVMDHYWQQGGVEQVVE
jgi:hypothetical protein